MKLRYNITKTGTRIPILEKLTSDSQKLYKDILTNMTYKLVDTKYLQSTNIKLNNLTNTKYELENMKYSSEIIDYLFSNNITGYETLISKFTPLEVIKKILKEYNTIKIYTFCSTST